MLPTSHAVPINQAQMLSLPNSSVLAGAFSEFIAASSQLEISYRDLQREVRHLNTELSERNAALTQSLSENNRMRAALQQIIDSMPCGVLVLDAQDRIRMINPEGRQLLNLNGQEVSCLEDLSVLSGICFNALTDDVSGGTEVEACLPSSKGDRWLAIGRRQLSLGSSASEVGLATLARQDEPLRSIWILRDISAQKSAEREREATRHAAALAETAAILAHEIRNPLASMELFAGLIAEDSNQTTQWLSHLRAGIRQLSGTVNNVLSLQPGAQPYLTCINLRDSVREAVEFARPLADQAGVQLAFKCEVEALTIKADENLVRQILLNLVGNAVRHTQAGGAICVELCKEINDGSVRAVLEIEDNGCGMPEDRLERIFEVGFSGRGDTPGLGLAVCKRILDQLNGTISVASQVGIGTIFRLELASL